MRKKNMRRLFLEDLSLKGRNRWQIKVEGEAELLSEPSRNMIVPAFGEKYASLIKAMGVDLERLVEDYSQPIRIKPTKFMSWDG
jgi:hypothetical protein